MARRNYKKTGPRSCEAHELTFLICAVRALAVTLVCSCILVLLSSAVVCSLSDPVSATDIAAWIALGVASLIGGAAAYFCSRGDFERTALISGGMFVCVLLILSFVTCSVSSPLWMTLGYAISIGLHLLGARIARRLFGAKKRKRRVY